MALSVLYASRTDWLVMDYERDTRDNGRLVGRLLHSMYPPSSGFNTN